MKSVNPIPFRYGNDTEPTGKKLPQLKDPIGGRWPTCEAHPNDYVSQIMPSLYNAAENRLSKVELKDALRNQFNVRLDNLPPEITKPLLFQFDACWVGAHGVSAPEKPLAEFSLEPSEIKHTPEGRGFVGKPDFSSTKLKKIEDATMSM